MSAEASLWDEQELARAQPHVDRTRQLIIQIFPQWLTHQVPLNESPDAVSKFKFRMINQIGKNLKKLGLDDLAEQLEKRTNQIVQKVETVAEAQQLLHTVRDWLAAHRDASQVFRVAESRSLLEIAKDFAAKLVSISRRIDIDMPHLGAVRAELSEFQKTVKAGIDKIEKRAGRFWKAKLCSKEELEELSEDLDSLITAFDGCANDLRDLHIIRETVRRYREDYRRLEDHRLTWQEFEQLAEELRTAPGEVVPCPPTEVIPSFDETIARQRRQASAAWIDKLESDAAGIESLPAAEANRLDERTKNPPAVLTEPHGTRLDKVTRSVNKRLGTLKLEVLVEKYRELDVPLRKRFLQLIESL